MRSPAWRLHHWGPYGFTIGKWDEDPDCLVSRLRYLPPRGDGNLTESLESGGLGSHLAFAGVDGATDFSL